MASHRHKKFKTNSKIKKLINSRTVQSSEDVSFV